ncbi:hypothetical protein PZB75_31185 (plasmid) [Streptomyces sp. AM 4-1-1]|uniref:hypothetical protein n=1 Tax=Streptomyces sp. AM 4-1-1 TaxID=3028710 RepID=UPI0023B8CF06|nr:hypothetical protein [Streptomyces sp. AM 4-1-1]WEH37868.1 hypothetical protein PZB75_31185 [Streptomyces sp. AM 4-1-1]
MNALTLAAQVPEIAPVLPGRRLYPRAGAQRPAPAEPPPVPALGVLEAERLTMNRVVLSVPGPTDVVLYALTGPGREVHDDLAAVRGYAAAHRLTVHGPPIVDALDATDVRTGGDDPLLRRGYARALRMLADPASPVRGVIAVSRTAITLADRLYQDQLTWYAARRAGLWLVRGETQI